MTLPKCHDIFIARGGDCIYVIIILIFSIFLSYNLVSIFFVYRKSKYLNSNLSKLKFSSNLFKNKFKKVKKLIVDLGNPYGITFKKYFVLKYIVSTFSFLSIYFVYSNLGLASIYFFSIYFLPEILFLIFKKNENIKILSELNNLTTSIILALSSYIPFFESLKLSINNIGYLRFKKEYENFTNDYLMYDFNMRLATKNFIDKFELDEFKIFLDMLNQSENEGNFLDNLEAFTGTLKLSYFKILKQKSARRLLYVSLATILSMLNILLIVMYPMFAQVTKNLSLIFM